MNMWKCASLSDVQESLTTNHVVWQRDGVRYRILPGLPNATPPELFGYVVPTLFGPVTSVWDQLLHQRDWLRSDLEDHWFRSQDAWCIADDQRWVEPALMVDALLHEVAVGDLHSRLLQHCERRGVPWIVRIQDGRFEVIDVTSSQVVSTQSFAVEPVSGACVLTGEAEVCRLRGGPWTSAARQAAAAWFDQRDRLITALGCNVCSGDGYELGGTRYSGRPIISITQPSVPTRWMQLASE